MPENSDKWVRKKKFSEKSKSRSRTIKNRRLTEQQKSSLKLEILHLATIHRIFFFKMFMNIFVLTFFKMKNLKKRKKKLNPELEQKNSEHQLIRASSCTTET